MAFQVESGPDSMISVTAGHWSDFDAETGCTVLLFERLAPTVVEIRGGAPGTRETALLGAGDLVQSVDAIFLTGGSAFGLAAAAGVMDFLRDQGRGVRTSTLPVPIVPAAVIYDLGTGQADWPVAANGRAACESAVPLLQLQRGRVGAGTGATTGKLWSGQPPVQGGIGLGACDVPGLGAVSAITVVNAAGSVFTGIDETDDRQELLTRCVSPQEGRSSTTLTVVLIRAETDRRALVRCAVAAHDGMARRIRPCHTIFDGDVVFVVGLRSGEVAPADVLALSVATELAVERSIVDAVTA